MLFAEETLFKVVSSNDVNENENAKVTGGFKDDSMETIEKEEMKLEPR